MWSPAPFPYGPSQAPPDIKCNGCGGNGWGPMLRAIVWRKVCHPSMGGLGFFLCEPCIEKRLGRPLLGTDLRDCPMNRLHRKYLAHGLVD